MRIISYNVNGIRSAINKGFTDWLATNPCDVICLQEIKAHKENVDFRQLEDLGFTTYWFPAKKKGYSGVAIFSKLPVEDVTYGNGNAQSDDEGRVISATINGVRIINAYFPSGTSGDERQTYKYQWLDEFFEHVNAQKAIYQKVLICGDYNICHQAIDIHNPVSNKNSSGFLPEERAWMDKWFASEMIDTFRHLNKDPHHYSWWSYRANARANNKGWRIDYISVSKSLVEAIEESAIFPDVHHSDHCPVYLKLKL